jgi:AraC-like DNA-binding protein
MAGPCHALAVSPFLSALLERAGLPQRYRLDDGDGRLMQVLIDVQAAQPEGCTCRCRVTGVCAAWPAPCAPSRSCRRLADWAQRIGMSERSMTRLFLAETGPPSTSGAVSSMYRCSSSLKGSAYRPWQMPSATKVRLPS